MFCDQCKKESDWDKIAYPADKPVVIYFLKCGHVLERGSKKDG